MIRRPFDSTVSFLNEGYAFASSRCDTWNTDLFTTRFFLQPTTFIRSEEAAGLFYEGDRFTREGAVPPNVQHLLQDKGSVQALGGEAQRRRKQAFLSLMGEDAMSDLGEIFDEEWAETLEIRPGPRRIVLHDFARIVLIRTACRWAGVPLEVTDVRHLTNELGMMIDQVTKAGPANWYAQWRRRGTEAWAAGPIEKVRQGNLSPSPGTALSVFAHHTDSDGQELSAEVAAVELINILRPILAIARFMVFAAVALVHHPRWRDAFASGDETGLEPFVQEVRRFYPYFPAVPGRVHEPFSWREHRFAEGDRAILGLYGTCHERRLGTDPDSFQPERFRGFSWDEHPNTLIAQGAGRHSENHRCPGEWSTVELLKSAVRLLVSSGLDVPTQDLSIPLNQFPALPRSGFVFHYTGRLGSDI